MRDSLHRMIERVDENYLHGVEERGSTEYLHRSTSLALFDPAWCVGHGRISDWIGRPVHKFFLLRH